MLYGVCLALTEPKKKNVLPVWSTPLSLNLSFKLRRRVHKYIPRSFLCVFIKHFGWSYFFCKQPKLLVILLLLCIFLLLIYLVVKNFVFSLEYLEKRKKIAYGVFFFIRLRSVCGCNWFFHFYELFIYGKKFNKINIFI